MRIRPATERDIPAIFQIYNEQVLHGTATFDTVPTTDDADQRAWFDAHGDARYPVIVCEEEGKVIAWASSSAWSGRCGYERAAEVSEYVHKDHRGRGIGTKLLIELIDRARESGVAVLIARIEAGGEASLHMHRGLGFRDIGVMRRVGLKFGRILDVVLLDLHLDEADA